MGDEPLGAGGRAWRYAAVVLFIAAWMACGWLLQLDANVYLLVGVPLTILFQWGLRRRPLRALWVGEAPPFRLGWAGIAIAAALSVVPLLTLAGAAVEGQWDDALFGVVSLVGAFGAAYAVRHFRREHLRPFAWCVLITLALDAIQWSLFLGFGLVTMTPTEGGPPERLLMGALSLLQYLAVVFVLEEVTFRMLDSHLHEAEGWPGIPSAIFLAVLWGLWHLPGQELTWQTVGVLLYVHVPYGVVLSLFWRKTGNLLIPGFCHALGDSIRNALMAGP